MPEHIALAPLAPWRELRTTRGDWDDADPAVLESMDGALSDLPAVELTAAQRHQVIDGRPLPLFQVPGWAQLPGSRPIRLRDARGLVALARVEAGQLRPFRLLRGGGLS